MTIDPNSRELSDLSVEVKNVLIPSCIHHEGYKSVRVTLLWMCRHCSGPRGDVYSGGASYDGDQRMTCDEWQNPCGHLDTYVDCRREAGLED